MIDMGTIASALGSLNAASQIAKGMINLRDMQEVQGKVIELQSIILAAQTSAIAAQSDQMSLIEEMRGLREKLGKLEAWESEKQRYQLTDFGNGTFAYVLKRDAAGNEPAHQLCATCFNQGHKTILQYSHDNWFDCYKCEKRFTLGPSRNRASTRAITDYNPFDQ